jgi:hypothetical protein
MEDELVAGAFAVLLEDAFRRVDRVEDVLRQLSYGYSGRVEDRSYRAFIRALLLAAQGMRQLLTDRKREFLNASLLEERRSRYQTLGADAANIELQLESHLPELGLEQAQELQVFAMPFTRMAKGIVKNVELLFFPWTYDGYETHVLGVMGIGIVDARLAEPLALAFGDDVMFIKLWHPATRERDIFHHAVFAHELAHAAIQQQIPLEKLAERDVPPKEGEPPTYETVASDAYDRPTRLTDGQEEMLLSWMREIACDIVAMRMIGPAFAVAFAEVTSPNRTLEPQDSGEHPPAHIRMRFLREEVKRFLPAEEHPELSALLDRYMAVPELASDAQIPGVTWLTKAIKRFRRYVPILLGDWEYRPGALRNDLPLIFELADQEVPPAERIVAVEEPTGAAPRAEGAWSTPLDWRSILNGMLLWHLKNHGFPVVTEVGEDLKARAAALEQERARFRHRETAARVAVSGIELAQFHERALHARQQFDSMRLPDELEERMYR